MQRQEQQADFIHKEEVQFVFPNRSCSCKKHNQLDIVVLNLLNSFLSDRPNESDNHFSVFYQHWNIRGLINTAYHDMKLTVLKSGNIHTNLN